MEITITPAAQVLILAHKPAQAKLLLDREDGRGPYTEGMMCCALELSFRLLWVPDSEQALYPTKIETAVGALYLKEGAELFLDKNLVLDVNPSSGVLYLKGNGGRIANHVRVESMMSV